MQVSKRGHMRKCSRGGKCDWDPLYKCVEMAQWPTALWISKKQWWY